MKNHILYILLIIYITNIASLIHITRATESSRSIHQVLCNKYLVLLLFKIQTWYVILMIKVVTDMCCAINVF